MTIFYGLLAVTRMSSLIEQAIIKPKLGYHVTEKECLRFAFRDRADSLAQLSLNARSRWDSHELELDQGTMASKLFVTHSLQHDDACNFAWYYASLVVYAVLDDFRGLELPRTRTRTRTWKLVLEDPRGQGFSSRTTTLLCLAVLRTCRMVRKGKRLSKVFVKTSSHIDQLHNFFHYHSQPKICNNLVIYIKIPPLPHYFNCYYLS